MDPESPTQSVASYGSNGSGTHLQRDTVGLGGGASSVSSDSSSSAGGGGVNSSSAINMPADMYSIFESYIDASQHLIAAHDTWDQAVLLLKRPNVASELHLLLWPDLVDWPQAKITTWSVYLYSKT